MSPSRRRRRTSIARRRVRARSCCGGGHGRHLFRRDTELATMRAIVDEIIHRRRRHARAPQLEQIIVRALQKKREDASRRRRRWRWRSSARLRRRGFSPLQLARISRSLRHEFVQWKKTVTRRSTSRPSPARALRRAAPLPCHQTGLADARPTVALRKVSPLHRSGSEPRERRAARTRRRASNSAPLRPTSDAPAPSRRAARAHAVPRVGRTRTPPGAAAAAPPARGGGARLGG